MRNLQLSLQSKFFFGIALIILPTLGIIFIWAGFQHEKQVMGQVMNQARAVTRQIVLTRQWISDCGGVMVLSESEGAKDTAYFFDDTLETPRGSFKRFTPSMVTKKMSQYSFRQDLYRLRLVSLNPMNPENRGSDFEKETLDRFKKEGLTEVFRTSTQGKESYFHYMVPLFVDKTCLSCHQGQGLSKGDVGGGLSIFFPISKMKTSLRKDHLRLAVFGAGLVTLTICTLFILLRRLVIRPMRRLEKVTAEIGNGNLDARVDITTGDEFEKLSGAFNSMAQRLSMNRNILEEKVRQATHELSKANKELQTLDKLKSDFLANMSHELRSPLTVIRGGIDYLNRTIKGKDNRDYLTIIDKNLVRLIRLVSDLFDFTKIEAGKADWSFDKEDLSELVEEVIDILSPIAMDKDITINYENPDSIYVKIDPERIEQVFVNLIENAIKYSEHSGLVQVEIKTEADQTLVSIEDHGIGIPEEKLEIIFKKFHTLPIPGGVDRRERTGLGLAICKGIIEAHGGRIWAESVEGKGSVFFFTLPRMK